MPKGPKGEKRPADAVGAAIRRRQLRPGGGSTYCHGCGGLLIERDWYMLGAWNLTADGRCVSCGAPCSGVFDGPPGRWGRKRLPVRLRDFAVA
jgi:hypothetical protein